MDPTNFHHRKSQKVGSFSVHEFERVRSGGSLTLAPFKKTGTIKMVASVTIACVDVARALGGIYLYALYRQTVGRITNKFD